MYIRFEVSAQAAAAPPAHADGAPPSSRWALRRLDRDALVVASVVIAWPETAERDRVDVEEEAVWFRGAMTQMCDAGMPRARPVPPCCGVYWWSREIADV